METSKFAFRLFSLAMALVLIFGISGLSALAADESDYVAEFKIVTDKVTLQKDEEVKVSVLLKTNYYICTMSLPVIYDSEAFTMQNTSETNVKGFLTFAGSMADSYTTNGNWKSPELFYTKRNSNTDYWSQADVMAKYKIAFASWSADTSVSYELVQLDEEEVISFVLKANRDIEDLSNLIFISLDFQKTASAQQGILFVGRSTTKDFSLDNMVNVGQTIIYRGVNPSDEVSASISPADGTDTVIDSENGIICGLEEGAESLDSFVKVEGYTLKYTYFGSSFGTGTKVECILNGETKETYYVVIFGDITGDGVIDTFDSATVAAIVNGDISIDGAFALAADVYPDEAIDTFDYAVVASVVNGDCDLSQNRA